MNSMITINPPGENYPLVIAIEHGDHPRPLVQFAIENGDRNSGFTQLQNGGSFHSYVTVYQRVKQLIMGISIIDDGEKWCYLRR